MTDRSGSIARLALPFLLSISSLGFAAAPAAEDADTALARRIVSAFGNFGPALSPDGKALAFVSNRDGSPELYLSDPAHPELPAKRLTTLHQRVLGPTFSPDGRWIVFMMDHDSDENFSLFRVHPDGTGLEELTSGEKLQRGPPGFPLGTPDTFLFSAHRPHEPGTRIYVQPFEPSRSPRLVFQDPGTASLVDINRDGTQALLERKSAGYDSVLLLADLRTGKARQIYPAKGASAQVHDASFSIDDKTIFVSTDGGKEQALILALDAKTLTIRRRYREQHPATAQINAVLPMLDGKKLVVLLYAGDHAELRVLDAKTLKPTTKVQMPLGDGDISRPRTRAPWIPVEWSTPAAPSDLYAVDLESGAVRPLRQESRPDLGGLGQVRVSREEVASFDGLRLPVNVYLPEPAPAARLPVLVWLHGGPPTATTFGFSPILRFYLARGYAVVAPNIRGSAGYGRAYVHADDGPKRKSSFRDLEAVGRWVSAQPWADKSRLVIGGPSFGGYLTLMALTQQPSLWKAGLDVFGIYNWRTFMKATSGAIHEIFQTEVGRESDTALLDALSPATAVDKIVAPLFVYAGAHDPRVPKTESDQLVASLKQRSVPVEYLLEPDEGHSFTHQTNLVAFLVHSARFLDAHLPAPAPTAAPTPR